MTNQEIVLEHIRQNPGILRDDLLYDMAAKMTRKEAATTVTRLVANGTIKREPSGKYDARRHAIPILTAVCDAPFIQQFMFAFVRGCVYDTHNRQGA